MRIKEGFVESEGHRIAYLLVNEHLSKDINEPAIVFIHGALASLNCWKDFLPDSYKYEKSWYSLSLPAHHPSEIPKHFNANQVTDKWFFRVMNTALKELLGDRKAILVGHSTGGFIALNLAMNHSPQVMGLISIGGFHNGKWSGLEGILVKIAGLGKFAKGIFVGNLVLSKFRFVQRIFSSLLAYNASNYKSNPLSEKFLDNIGPNILNQNFGALFPFFSGMNSIEIKEQLSTIDVPCYIFAGVQDPVVTAKQTLTIIGKIPDAKTVIFDEVGHMPFIETTECFHQSLESAVNEIIKERTQ